MAAALAGLIAANTALAPAYQALLDLPITVKAGTIGVDKPLLLWINDGLMAVFFLLVALELKREMLEGQLAERSRLALPAVCALGGMAVPMAVYAALNRGDGAAMAGVAIPAATDIAFALGVLALLGSRVPSSLKLLLTAIAVLDDLGAIVLIALFYSQELSWWSLGVAGVALTGLVLLIRAGVARVGPYMLLGVVMWLAVLKSGVHATLAGVALGMTIPLRDARHPGHSPALALEHALHPWTAFGILPLFAFANAGVPLAGLSPASLLLPVPLGIAAGLLLGKTAGVFGAAAALVGLRGARLPPGITWGVLFGMALLCGIGFTMSLFIGSLAFGGGGEYDVQTRIGILTGSLASALLGLATLHLALARRGT